MATVQRSHKGPHAAGLQWAWFRLVLGFAQMGGAVLSVTFMTTLGIEHPWSVAAVLATTASTATSLAIFPRVVDGRERRPG